MNRLLILGVLGLASVGLGQTKVDKTWDDNRGTRESISTQSSYALTVPAVDGSMMIRLPDSEYSHLQALRQAVIDEEKRLAVKYGAQTESVIAHFAYNPDRYSFHGQFLLIERAK